MTTPSFADLMANAFNPEKDPVSDEAILQAYLEEVLYAGDSDDSDDDPDDEGVACDAEFDPELAPEEQPCEDPANTDADMKTAEGEEADPEEDSEEDDSDAEEDDSDDDTIPPVFYPAPSLDRVTRFVLSRYRMARVRYFPEEIKATVRLIRLVFHSDPEDDECRETGDLVREIWSSN